jgi:hypothetical protein
MYCFYYTILQVDADAFLSVQIKNTIYEELSEDEEKEDIIDEYDSDGTIVDENESETKSENGTTEGEINK